MQDDNGDTPLDLLRMSSSDSDEQTHDKENIRKLLLTPPSTLHAKQMSNAPQLEKALTVNFAAYHRASIIGRASAPRHYVSCARVCQTIPASQSNN